MITVSDDENIMDRNVQGYCKEKRTPIESHQRLPIADQAPISLLSLPVGQPTEKSS